MAKVSDELVERVAQAIGDDVTLRVNELFDNAEPNLSTDQEWVNGEGKAIARAAIAAMSTPDSVAELVRVMVEGMSWDEKNRALETVLAAYRNAGGHQ